jgi:hypothetical protein
MTGLQKWPCTSLASVRDSADHVLSADWLMGLKGLRGSL